MTDDINALADAFDRALSRAVRQSLYTRITDGVHDAVGAPDYPVLSDVDRLGPVSIVDLAEALGLDRSVVSRRVAALTEAGLIKSSPNPANARATHLTLTATGRRVLAKSRRRLVSAIGDRVGSWSATDQRRFTQLLTRFLDSGTF